MLEERLTNNNISKVINSAGHDTKSQRILFNHCQKISRKAIRRYGFDDEMVNDVVMLSTEKVFANLDRFKKNDSIKSFDAFITVVSKNTAVTSMNKYGKLGFRVEFADGLHDKHEYDTPTNYDDVFRGMSEIEKEMAILYYFNGRSLSEISRDLSITLNCAKIRLSRAAKKIRRNYAEC